MGSTDPMLPTRLGIRQGSSCDRGGENRAITGQGGGYAGRGLSIGVPEKIRGVALRATSPKHKVAPINQGSRTHTEESSFPQGMTREAT